MKRWAAMVTLGLSMAGCGGGEERVVIPPAPATFERVQDTIFTPSCAITGCHVGGGAPFALDLSDGVAYGNIVDVPSAEIPTYYRVDRIVPVDSYLYMKVTGDTRIQGDQMPAEGDLLTPQQTQLILRWIADGANP